MFDAHAVREPPQGKGRTNEIMKFPGGTQICQAFQEFNGPFIITNGGPRNSTTLISILVYNYAFKSNQMGMASALAWIMFVIVCILTIIAFTSQKKWVYYSDER